MFIRESGLTKFIELIIYLERIYQMSKNKKQGKTLKKIAGSIFFFWYSHLVQSKNNTWKPKNILSEEISVAS